MKYTILFVLLSVLSGTTVFSQIAYWHQTNGPEAGTLRDITIDSTGNVFIWTQGSGVYKSSDNGNSWQLLNKGLSTLNMKRGAFERSGYLFGGNVQNQIFRLNENDPSASWVEVTPVKDTTITQYDILAAPNGSIYLATVHGVQRSDDEGITWHQKNFHLKDSLSAKNFDSSVVYLAIDDNENLIAALHYGGIFRSTDNAESWTKLPSRDPDGPQINALAIAANGNIIIGNIERDASNGGKIYVSIDTGKTWNAVYQRPSTTQEIKNNVEKIVRVPGSNVLYANAHGPTLRSVDNGLTWNVMDTNKRGDEPFSMAVFGNNVYQMCEPDGVFLSNDNGVTWTAKNKGLYAQLMWDLAINSKQELFGITEYGLHRSTDSGDSWDQAPEYGETYFPSIFIDQKDNLFIGTNRGLFRSKDNGNTLDHIVINLDTSLVFNIIVQVGANDKGKLFCSTLVDSIKFISSTDEGDHWTKVQNLPEKSTSINAMAFASKDTILLASDASAYYRSLDDGNSWSIVSNNCNGTGKLLIHPDGSYLALLQYDGGGVLRSTDGAQTWSKIFPPEDFQQKFTHYYSMMVDHSGRIIVCTDSGIYRSADNQLFAQWFSISTGITAHDFPNHYINASAVVENPVSHLFFAASRGLSVFKSIPDFDTTKVGVSGDVSPIEPITLSARPNPFSTSTNIEFTTGKTSEATIQIYDILGRDVETLFSGQIEQGEHTVTFNGSDLPNGSYLVVLHTGGRTYSSRITLTR